MSNQPTAIRDAQAGDLLEAMLVVAVVTVLAIRGFLALTGYPQLGGSQLHIAHMLWGGLAMMVAIALLLSYWSKTMRQIGAIVGGLGFGFFIDELGKFITQDNDYFFQPTIALLYALFVVLFIGVRALQSKTLTKLEVSVNRRINEALAEGDATSRAFQIYKHITGVLRHWYDRLIVARWFAPALSTLFIASAVAQIIAIVTLVTGESSQSDIERHLPIVERAAIAVSGLFVVLGVFRLQQSRLAAYRWFQRSTLVTILVTQVFMFYYSELAALGGLVVHLLLYSALRILVAGEEDLEAERRRQVDRSPEPSQRPEASSG